MDITCPFALPPPRHVEARVRIYEEDHEPHTLIKILGLEYHWQTQGSPYLNMKFSASCQISQIIDKFGLASYNNFLNIYLSLSWKFIINQLTI